MPDDLPYRGIDTWDTQTILTALNREDRLVPMVVGQAIPQIAPVVDAMVEALGRGGRIHYFGAGSSGRLAVVDAYECPPTFGIPPSTVQAHLAGGRDAFAEAVESIEDDAEQGARDARDAGISCGDVVIGVSASGNTPYVAGAIEEANRIGARSAVVVCARGGVLERLARHVIAVEVGPEVVSGSTRLKAGSAQKLVLNMLSTATFVRRGHVYDGLMVAVRTDNAKLVERAIAVIRRITGATAEAAAAMLRECGMDARVAVVALSLQLSPREARDRLSGAEGHLRLALNGATGEYRV